MALAAGGGCGYHAGTHPTVLPATIKTVAVPAFGNATPNYRLPALLTADVTRELISRTRYNVVADPAQADATLTGAVVNFVSSPRVAVGAASVGVEAIVVVNLRLTDRHTGKVLFDRPSAEFHERYEVATNPQQYFDESGTAIQRLSTEPAKITAATLKPTM
jgi:hypothetical protein